VSITVAELAGSRSTGEMKYIVKGTDDDLAALAALLAAAPATNGVRIKNADGSTVEPIGDGSDCWLGVVRYDLASGGSTQSSSKAAGESTYQFDTGGGTQHITHCKPGGHIEDYAETDKTAPNHQGAIGVATKDGNVSVDGVDITVPTYSFSETHYMADTLADADFRMYLFNITGCVNDAPFKGFAGGEVLFLGASGSQRDDDGVWEINFKYAASPNKTDLMIGSIGPIDKGGWECMWIEYEDEDDTAASAPVQRAFAVHVERVYDSASFSGLP
jgi:hypothetical protein